MKHFIVDSRWLLVNSRVPALKEASHFKMAQFISCTFLIKRGEFWRKIAHEITCAELAKSGFLAKFRGVVNCRKLANGNAILKICARFFVKKRSKNVPASGISASLQQNPVKYRSIWGRLANLRQWNEQKQPQTATKSVRKSQKTFK